MSYVTRVYRDRGGDRIVVASGGVISIDGGQWQASDQQAPLIGQTVDNTGGIPGDTIADVGGSFNQVILNNNFSSLMARINKIESVVRALGMTASS